MVVWAGIVFLLVFLIIPFGTGNLLIRSKSFALTILGGLFFSFCVFEVLAVIFHITLGSLRLLTAIWCGICMAVALAGWRKAARGHRPAFGRGAEWTQIERVLLLVAVALVVFQTMNTVLNTFYGNWDDATYGGTAATSWYTDTVDRYDSWFGVLRPAFYATQYNLAAWPVYSSMLSVLTGIHPVIIYRTILPLFEIPLAYYIAYMLIRTFWKERRGKALLALVYYNIFTLLAAENMPGTSGEWWLVVNIWTGKALAAAIVIPLILWLLIQVEEKQKDKEYTRQLWRVLLFVCWAGCFISASLFFIVPLQLALWGGLYLLRTKKWKDFKKFVLCALPALACVLVTLL